MNEKFEFTSKTIKERRTIKPDHMNGQVVPEDYISQLLQLADFAPTHGRTEPWRFFIFEGKEFQDFCLSHAEMYRQHHPNFKENTYEKLKSFSETASHLIVVCMKRTLDSKISAQEEYAACCAATQNILLGASALQIASMWNTGAMAYSNQMKQWLNLEAEDQVVGFLYLGYTDEEAKPALRKLPVQEKLLTINH